MNDYTRQIIVNRHLDELRRAAAEERLARRARVRRDGTISFTRKVGVAFSAGLDRLTAVTGSLTPRRPNTAHS